MMRFYNNKYQLIYKLKNRSWEDYSDLPFMSLLDLEQTELGDKFKQLIPTLVTEALSLNNIYYFTDTIMSYIVDSEESPGLVTDEQKIELLEIGELSEIGCIITHNLITFYNINPKDENGNTPSETNGVSFFITFKVTADGQYLILAQAIMGQFQKEDLTKYKWFGVKVKERYNNKETQLGLLSQVNYGKLMLDAVIFKNFVDVETVVLKPGDKHKKFNSTKYTNKTKSNITIVDSTWFKEIIRNEGFSVRGHFRLQPYGEKMSKRKLIWIKGFKKDGYHRKAKKDLTRELENG